MVIAGGCFCGAIRYELTGELFNVTICHCPTCRRVSGAPSVAWASVAISDFAWHKGAPATLHSSDQVLRTFCAACGTPLTYQASATPQEIDVTVGSLDRPQDVAPADHTQTSYRLPWVCINDGLPLYPHSRAAGVQS